MSNGFIYVVDAHFIDKIEENKYPGPKCLWCWPVKCSIQRNSEHNEWIDLNTMSVIRWAGTAYSFGTPELSSCFLFGTCCSSLVFCVFFVHIDYCLSGLFLSHFYPFFYFFLIVLRYFDNLLVSCAFHDIRRLNPRIVTPRQSL